MNAYEKAEIILKELEKYIVIDEAFREIYIKSIVNGLVEIAQKEKAAN